MVGVKGKVSRMRVIQPVVVIVGKYGHGRTRIYLRGPPTPGRRGVVTGLADERWCIESRVVKCSRHGSRPRRQQIWQTKPNGFTVGKTGTLILMSIGNFARQTLRPHNLNAASLACPSSRPLLAILIHEQSNVKLALWAQGTDRDVFRTPLEE